MANGFTDIHIHLLPGLDDGPDDMSQSVRMLAALADLGYKRVVATPHRIASLYNAPPDEVEKALSGLEQAANDAGITSVRLTWSRECHFDRLLMEELMQESFVELARGARTFLFELPFGGVPDQVPEFLFHVGLSGFKPVLAHPERNQEIASNPAIVEDLKAKGARILINLGSLVGKYGRAAKKAARWIVDNGLADAAATDAHTVSDITKIAANALREIESRWGAQTLHELLVVGPGTLLGEGEGER